MDVCGKLSKTWSDATHGLVVGISYDAYWREQILPIVLSDGREVVLRGSLENLRLRIKRRNGQEYVWVMNQCPLRLVAGYPEVRHKCLPFKGESDG